MKTVEHSDLLLHLILGLWKSYGGKKTNLQPECIQMVYTNMLAQRDKRTKWKRERGGERKRGQLVKLSTLPSVAQLRHAARCLQHAIYRPHPIPACCSTKTNRRGGSGSTIEALMSPDKSFYTKCAFRDNCTGHGRP